MSPSSAPEARSLFPFWEPRIPLLQVPYGMAMNPAFQPAVEGGTTPCGVASIICRAIDTMNWNRGFWKTLKLSRQAGKTQCRDGGQQQTQIIALFLPFLANILPSALTRHQASMHEATATMMYTTQCGEVIPAYLKNACSTCSTSIWKR